MNVAFVVHRHDVREGTGGYVTRVLPYVAQHHEVTLYALDVPTPLPDGVRVVRVPALKRPSTATILSFPVGFESVRGRHDLIHAQGWVTRSADVVTAHIVLAAWRDAARGAGVLGRGERLISWATVTAEETLMRTARAVIVPSRRAAHDIGYWYGRTAGVHVVPHGFTVMSRRNASRAEFGLPPDTLLALYAGDARKGLDEALHAIVPTVAHLAVVTNSRASRYRARAEALGVAERVHWIGPLDDISQAYALADLLLYPSRYDTFGLVVSEAMAAGLPVIASPRTGVSELLRDGENALLADDPATAAAALDRLGRDAVLRRRLGDAARVTAQTYTWERTADRTLAVYEEVARG